MYLLDCRLGGKDCHSCFCVSSEGDYIFHLYFLSKIFHTTVSLG